ncbi:hypothetical protein B0T22DRAFT_11017 [Podospora appendiculata]|uniref:Uncharacterized protein n=1 Tax=Podospora appendiculata TaxID=314037 RepID=A0AAE1CFD6_9PEZI|nr:hypothetical protein B0T22DRAFT_11017 [Podospora appendiculata]
MAIGKMEFSGPFSRLVVPGCCLCGWMALAHLALLSHSPQLLWAKYLVALALVFRLFKESLKAKLALSRVHLSRLAWRREEITLGILILFNRGVRDDGNCKGEGRGQGRFWGTDPSSHG